MGRLPQTHCTQQKRRHRTNSSRATKSQTPRTLNHQEKGHHEDSYCRNCNVIQEGASYLLACVGLWYKRLAWQTCKNLSYSFTFTYPSLVMACWLDDSLNRLIRRNGF